MNRAFHMLIAGAFVASLAGCNQSQPRNEGAQSPDVPAAAAAGELKIEVTVRRDRTMSLYRMKKGDKLTFKNDSKDGTLVVTPKDLSPFVEDDETMTPVREIRVESGQEKTVQIDPAFAESEFLYTAQIGDYTAEDPIVIIER